MLRPKEVVCKWVDAFNNHDVEAIVSLYHDNATNHQVTNDPVIGIDAIREMFTTEFATADMTAIVENIFSLPGLGYRIVDSLTNRDLPVIYATVLFLAFALVIFNILADIIQRLLQTRKGGAA